VAGRASALPGAFGASIGAAVVRCIGTNSGVFVVGFPNSLFFYLFRMKTITNQVQGSFDDYPISDHSWFHEDDEEEKMPK